MEGENMLTYNSGRQGSHSPNFNCLDMSPEKYGKRLFHIIMNTSSCLCLQKLPLPWAFWCKEERMKPQSGFFMLEWISDLDFTPKMPVFYFQNLNKYVFLLCIRCLRLTWKSSDQMGFFLLMKLHLSLYDHTPKLQSSSSFSRNLI